MGFVGLNKAPKIGKIVENDDNVDYIEDKQSAIKDYLSVIR